MTDNRTPVALIALPSSPYFLGCFDVTNFQSFWLSHPVPGSVAVDYIKKGMHIYGREHLAIVKLTNGTWEVCRSKNYGIDWAVVFTTMDEIYDITLIRYGWAIMNTSEGFYETVNAGTTWTQIANLPPAPNAPSITNIGISNDTIPTGTDVLLCTDGRYIWRSTDTARTWTLVLDQQALGRIYNTGPYSAYQRFTYSGISSPCIAGACDLVICGHGPYISLSLDGGLHWVDMQRWAMYYEGNCNSTLSVIWARMGKANANPPPFVIKQVLIESVNGPTADDIHFVLRYDDRIPMSGESTLYSRVFISRSCPVEAIPIIFDYKFQQYLSLNDNSNQISAFNLPITGSDQISSLIFSAQTKIDSTTGHSVISLKYSNDNGQTWTDIDTSSIPVMNQSGLPIYNLSDLGDSFAKNTWVYGSCDNHGSWISSGSRLQNLSQEMDLMLGTKKSQAFSLGAIVSKDRTKTVQLDMMLQKARTKTFPLDTILIGKSKPSWLADAMVEGIGTKHFGLDMNIGLDHSQDWQMDARLWATYKMIYHLDLLLGGHSQTQYLLDMILERYRLNQRLSKMENITPQFLDLDVPFIPSTPYNSALESL